MKGLLQRRGYVVYAGGEYSLIEICVFGVLLWGANVLNWEADLLVLSLWLDQFVPVVYVRKYCKQWVILICIDLSVLKRDFPNASHFIVMHYSWCCQTTGNSYLLFSSPFVQFGLFILYKDAELSQVSIVAKCSQFSKIAEMNHVSVIKYRYYGNTSWNRLSWWGHTVF